MSETVIYVIILSPLLFVVAYLTFWAPGIFLEMFLGTALAPIVWCLDRLEKTGARFGFPHIVKVILIGPILLFCGPLLVAGAVFATPDVPWPISVACIVAIIAIVVLAVKLTPRTILRVFPAHTATLDTAEGYVSSPEQPELIGCEGMAKGALRPAGIAQIGAVRRDVVTLGGFIEAGVQVKVIAVEGNRIVVERAE